MPVYSVNGKSASERGNNVCPRQELQRVNVLFIGGGRGCYEILRLLDSYTPVRIQPNVVAVIDLNLNAMGSKYARQLGIDTVTTWEKYVRDERIDLIIELTGDERVLAKIVAEKLPAVKVLDHLSALFLWEIIDIQEQKLQLEAKVSSLDTMAALGEIAFRLTHELRNPLLIVGGLVRRMMTRPDLPHGVRKRFKHLANHVLHMDTVLSDICDVVRPMSPHYVLTDMNDFFEKWCTTVRTEARYIGANLEASIEDDLPCMYIDPILIRQALWHILENSLDAIGEKGGGIYVTVQICWDEIDIQLSDSAEEFCALSPLKAVQPFTTTKSGRMGLGLSLCRQIILDHGGDLKLVQRADGGCIVLVQLPIRFREPKTVGTSESDGVVVDNGGAVEEPVEC
ncbi:ATP-binding protein [Desulfosediminicola ganghwensis]|uniref:ATP-binding protein n=1 Tax=Desulfosediminicola ganghwensis TaxID=2569540 RepID=UPI00142EF40A|nr:ATP-binding protein [Desulfosediminicola ganghwensis]